MPLYQDKQLGLITGAGRLCVEILGVTAELEATPPSFVTNICSMQFSQPIEVSMAKRKSGIVRVQSYIERYAPVFEEHGLIHYFQNELVFAHFIVLVDAANWVRLLPSMLIAGPQVRAGVVTILLFSHLYKLPAPVEELGVGLIALGVLSFLDLALMLYLVPRGRKLKELRVEATAFMLHMLVPALCIMGVVVSLSQLILFINWSGMLEPVPSSS